ncbi:MAG: BON domain-containing protein, partial [Caulobacteraceae bacterium]
MSRLRIIPALLAAGCVALGGPMASAQTYAGGGLSGGPAPAAAYDAPGTLRVDLAAGGSQTLSLPRGKSAIVELPVDARDVLVTNPAVADAMLRTPRRIYILGVASGQTDAVFFDASGRRILSLNVRVDQDISALADTINRVLPGSRVTIEPIGDSIILSGLVLTPSDADKAGQIAKRFVAKPEQVVNMISVAGSDQVMLQVRVVEVNRNVVKQLGFDLGAVIGRLGEDQLSIASTATFGVNGGLLGGMAGGYVKDTTLGGTVPGSSDVNSANATIKAFERVGLVRTLAQPVLTSVNGEPANFLAGGEFPVPVGQDSDGRVTIEFKKYGVGLGFTPVVMSGGLINLKVAVEVSELSN